jgi:integrase
MPNIRKRVHLTKRMIDSTAPRADDVFRWDDEVRGFGVRVRPNGLKVYVLQYRNAGGRSRRVTLGHHGPLTAEAARQLALAHRARIAAGADPAAERAERRASETFDAFAKRYLTQHAEPHKKAASVANDRMMLTHHILPAIGSVQVAAVTRSDVTKLHQSMRATPYLANRCLALISAMLHLAERWGVRPDGSNPCRHVQKYPEHRRQRFLSSAELGRLGKVLTAVERENVEHPSVVPAVRLLLLTGARRGEVLGLRWHHVNWERQCLDLPDSKTGPKTVHLNPPALEVLSTLADRRKDGARWVLPGRETGKPLVGLPHAWQRIRNRAGLDDVRLHDLRHSFASVAAAQHTSLPIIGALLGHTQPSTTARYAHLAADPLKEATTRVGYHIAKMMNPAPARAETVADLPKRRRAR